MIHSVLRTVGIASAVAGALLVGLFLLPASSEKMPSIPLELRGRFVRATDAVIWYIDPIHRDRMPLRNEEDVARFLRVRGLGVSEEQFTNTESLAARLSGRIVLRVEHRGEAYYIDPDRHTLHTLGRPREAIIFFQQQARAVSDGELFAIPITQ